MLLIGGIFWGAQVLMFLLVMRLLPRENWFTGFAAATFVQCGCLMFAGLLTSAPMALRPVLAGFVIWTVSTLIIKARHDRQKAGLTP